MNERTGYTVRCPYYRQERYRRKTPTGCEGSYYISCQGPFDGSYASFFFRSREKMDAVRRRYCKGAFQDCPFAKSMMEKDEG